MMLHPVGELRRAHQAGLYRDVSEVRGGNGLLVAICRRGETAEDGDDLDHDRRTPSLRWALAPLIKYMVAPSNKTGVALRIFDTTETLAFPGYINAAVE